MAKIEMTPNEIENYVDYLRELNKEDLQNEWNINKRLGMEHKNEVMKERLDFIGD